MLPLRDLRICAVVLALAVAALAAGAGAARAATLTVAADPNNLPFSNVRRQGFENELARLLADDLGDSLRYVWWPQRRGFIRSTLNVRAGDVVIGVPADYGLAVTTRPYYRSTYVFVTRRDRHLALRSLDDPALASLRIGIPVIGGDYAATPAEQVLVARGLVRNLVGYVLPGDASRPNPPADLIEAVADGAVDVAVAWGPLAGWFARRCRVPLEITPIAAPAAGPPLTFDISMAVPRDRPGLKDTLDGFIVRRRDDIRRLLESYGVPLVAGAP